MNKIQTNRGVSGFEAIVLGFTLHAIGGMARTVSGNDMPMILLGLLAWFFIIKGLKKIHFSLCFNGIRGGVQVPLALLFGYMFSDDCARLSH